MLAQISSSYSPPIGLDSAAPTLLWQMAWYKAVGLAWSRPELERELLQDPRGFLEARCGYELPEGISLEVRPYGAGSGHEQRPMHLTLTLPPRPGRPEDAAVALSDYMSAGQELPGTCC